MNKVQIAYNLDNPHEKIAFERAIKSTDLALVLWEILKNKRESIFDQIKTSKLELTAYDGVEFVYEEIFDLLEKYELDLNKLII